MKKVLFAILAASASAGLAMGVLGYTFVYAEGYSYLTDRPAACANCHVMQEQYGGWIKSSHRLAATCNDCHTPDGILGAYATKALNGFWHSFAFTSGRFPDPIRINARNRKIAESSCSKCHQSMADSIEAAHKDPARVSCVRCHGSVGH